MSTAMLRRHKKNREATKAQDLAGVAEEAVETEETAEAVETEEAEPTIDYEALSYKELQELGKERGIENVNIKKDKLKKLLSEAV